VKRIFIACPPIETGGPEALHQLCHVINSGGYQYEDESDVPKDDVSVDEFGREVKKSANQVVSKRRVKAFMLYLKERHNSIVIAEGITRPAKYLRYDAPVADVLPVVDGCSVGQDGYSSDLVVWPEIWTKYIDALQPNSKSDHCSDNSKQQKYQIAIWWLSVDNNRGAFGPKDFRERCDVLHLVQSYYARQYVTSNVGGKRQLNGNRQAKILDLTEFIPYAGSDSASSNQITVEDEGVKATVVQSTRDLDVVYNPAKGMHYTDEIMRRAGNKRSRTGADGGAVVKAIKFHPIGGEGGKDRLSGEEVVALLKRAKVVSLSIFSAWIFFARCTFGSQQSRTNNFISTSTLGIIQEWIGSHERQPLRDVSLLPTGKVLPITKRMFLFLANSNAQHLTLMPYSHF
jgi:hypothetical protein